MKANKDYRPDIDGLRAIAVLSVVFFHLGIGGIRGGFVGVDVFFVISGYLITKIISTEIEQKDFSFIRFYERRIRRIFPALFAVIGVTLLLGTWILLPHDLVLLTRATWATLSFGSNILFWRRSGYFDSSAELNPLLHTWSLAVEEQFYVLFPIVLIMVYRYLHYWKNAIILMMSIVALSACIYIQQLRPTATFFLAPFRAWELLIGSLFAMRAIPFLQSPAGREFGAWTGFVLLVMSIILTQPGVNFPGWQAMIPVLGTALLIYIGDSGGASVNNVLSRKPFIFIGVISYSLYLWHWPFIVYLRYTGYNIGVYERWFLLLVLLVIAYASYRWVEQPFRFQKRKHVLSVSGKSVIIGGMVGSIFIAIMAFIAQIDDGYLSRLSPELAVLNTNILPEIPYKNCDGKLLRSTSKNDCIIGDKSSVNKVLIWGDSHALAWVPGLDQIFKRNGVQGVLAIHSACPPLIGVINPVSFSCNSFNNNTMDWLGINHVKNVIMIASWQSYSMEPGLYAIEDTRGKIGNRAVFYSALERTMASLRITEIPMTLIAPTPGAPDDVVRKVLIARLRGEADPPGRSCLSFRKESANFWDAVATVGNSEFLRVIDPLKFFCDGGNAASYKNSKNELLYRDAGHLSKLGANFLAESLEHEIMSHILF